MKYFSPRAWYRKLNSLRRPVVQAAPVHPYTQQLRALNATPPWCFDFVHIAEDYIEIRGWAMLPLREPLPETGAAQVTFTLNDAEFDQVLFPLPWHKLGRIFWYWPSSSTSGFICRANRDTREAFANGQVSFKYVDSATLQPLNPAHNYYFADPAQDHHIPMPEAERRKRVHGDALLSAFLLEGFTTSVKLAHILQETVGKNYAAFPRVLDWGCGCGRLARYLLPQLSAPLTGIDIDEDNIAWCQQNLPSGDYFHISPTPPTQFENDTFDLIIGISIFTHLREPDQFLWLEELHRIACPDGILLVTVHGNTTVGRAALPETAFIQLQKDGFLDIGRNPNLDGVTSDHEYYRNTFHTEAYLRQHWAKWFEIVRIVPGTIGNHQDVVVLRKKR